MASNPLTQRSRILGLPIGPRQMAWGKVASLAWKVLAAIGVSFAIYKGGQKLLGSGVVQAGEHVLEEGQDLLEEGEEAVGKINGVIETVSNVISAVSGASGFFGKLKAGLQALGVLGGGKDKSKKLRLHIKLAQDVAVPRTVAYNQWTQLEDLPQFMKGVQSVELQEGEGGEEEQEGEDGEEEEDDPGNIAQSSWTVKIGLSRRQFSAEVTEAVPDERIVWESTEGPQHEGVVTFASLDDNLTRVQVQMLYVPSGFVEKIGNIFLAARRKARKDLRLYKHYLELSGEETGAWRGEITPDEEEEGEEEEGQEGEPGGEGRAA